MQKILIIRFSSIGDVVLTTPVIRCLKQQLPEADIHFLTKEKFYPVISANPHLSGIHLLKDNMPSLLRELREENFDFIVDLHKNLRSLRVKKALKIPSGTFKKLNSSKWLLVNLKIDRLPKVHIVDRYFGAVEKLAVKNDGLGLEYFIPDEDELQLTDLPPTHADGFIAFVIGGMHNTKMLPEERMTELCKLIEKPIVLLGGPGDREKGERLVQACGRNLYNSCGLFNINQSASVIRLADKVVTHDTGLMHIAAAFRKEIHSLWGNTVPAFGMFPYLPQGEGRSYIHEVEGLACRPCSKIGYAKCPKKHFRCMMDQDLHALADKINT